MEEFKSDIINIDTTSKHMANQVNKTWLARHKILKNDKECTV